MARINAAALKASVDLAELVRRHGVELKHQGDDLVGLCPFHPEDTPSFRVTPGKQLFHCFGCGAAGDAITWVQKTRHVSFLKAVELLKAHGASLPTTAAASLPVLITEETSAQDALDLVAGYYAERLASVNDALNYAEERLISKEAIGHFRIGVADRSLGYRLPPTTTPQGKAARSTLEQLGFIKENGREFFRGCLTFPMVDKNGHVVGMYGRRVKAPQNGSPAHLYLKGPHRGVFNLEGIRGQETVILCEAIIDALTFWSAGLKNVTCAYGADGLTDEVLKELTQAKRVLIAFDRDETGDRCALKVAQKLTAAGVECARIKFPHGMDANAYAQKVKPVAKALQTVVNAAEWLGGGAPAPVAAVAEVTSEKAALEGKVSATEHVEAMPAEVPPPTEVAPAAPPQKPTPTKVEALTRNLLDDDFTMQRGGRFYRAQGFQKNATSTTLKVVLSVRSGENFHKDVLDLNVELPRVRFEKAAARELGVEDSVVHRDVGEIVRELEAILDERNLSKAKGQAQDVPTMTEGERVQAERFLKDPDLLLRVLQDFDRVGIVGEELNKLICYLAVTSRKLRKPLAIMLKSSPAAGKSSLMDAVLSFVPEEDVKKYTAMTEKSLYYMAEDKLAHKVLALAEEEGAEPAAYALKLLQSEGELNIASTTKDGNGNLLTKDYHIDGPVMVFQTTTKEDTDVEFSSRCIELCADESEEQTGRIHDAQRRAYGLEALTREGDKASLHRLHRNAQRLLKALPVRMPFKDELRFPRHRMQLRRDNPKYLALIEACAVVHQYQRKVHEVVTEAGEVVEYIEATVTDLEVANQLAIRIWGKNLDGLSQRARQFLEELRAAVLAECEREHTPQNAFMFTARWVWEHMDLSPARVKVYLAALVDMELLRVHRPSKGVQGALYELDWYGEGLDGERFVSGLTDIAEVRRKFGAPMDMNGLWLACGSGVARQRLASGSVVARSQAQRLNGQKHDSEETGGNISVPAGGGAR